MSKRPSSRSLRRICLERDDYTCAVCGLREPAIMHVDHRVPRHACDNYDALDNLVTLCPNDHARKTVADLAKYPHPVWNRGRKCTPEEIAKLNTDGLAVGRQWAKGRRFSAEHRQRLSEAHRGQVSHFKGKTLTIEHRQKLSASHRGKIPWNKGVKRSSIEAA